MSNTEDWKLKREQAELKAQSLAEANIGISCYARFYMSNGYIFQLGPYKGRTICSTHTQSIPEYQTSYDVTVEMLLAVRTEAVAKCNLSGDFFYPARADRIELITENQKGERIPNQ